MTDELKTKAEEFEQEINSWSLGSRVEVEALCENISEIENRIRQLRASVNRTQQENANLIQENANLKQENEELKSVMEIFLRASEKVLEASPQTWISDLKEKCSTLIDAATGVEYAPASPVSTQRSCPGAMSNHSAGDLPEHEEETQFDDLMARVQRLTERF